jgi:hypothetical protein
MKRPVVPVVLSPPRRSLIDWVAWLRMVCSTLTATWLLRSVPEAACVRREALTGEMLPMACGLNIGRCKLAGHPLSRGSRC